MIDPAELEPCTRVSPAVLETLVNQGLEALRRREHSGLQRAIEIGAFAIVGILIVFSLGFPGLILQAWLGFPHAYVIVTPFVAAALAVGLGFGFIYPRRAVLRLKNSRFVWAELRSFRGTDYLVAFEGEVRKAYRRRYWINPKDKRRFGYSHSFYDAEIYLDGGGRLATLWHEKAAELLIPTTRRRLEVSMARIVRRERELAKRGGIEAIETIVRDEYRPKDLRRWAIAHLENLRDDHPAEVAAGQLTVAVNEPERGQLELINDAGGLSDSTES